MYLIVFTDVELARMKAIFSTGVPSGTIKAKIDGAQTIEQVKEQVVGRLRDVIHEKPFSKCTMGSDTCDDWPLAYELADVVVRGLD
jgi:hypothetical protein